MTNTFDMRLKTGVSENDASSANLKRQIPCSSKFLPFVYLFVEFIGNTSNAPEVNFYRVN